MRKRYSNEPGYKKNFAHMGANKTRRLLLDDLPLAMGNMATVILAPLTNYKEKRGERRMERGKTELDLRGF